MKILIVTPFGFRPRLRSFTDYVLARALVEAGHQVTAVTYAQVGDPHLNTLDGITVFRVRRYRGVFPGVWRVLLAQQWDVVHIFHQRNLMAPWVTLLAKASGTPVILSEWGLLHDPYLSADRDRPLATAPTYSRVIPSLMAAVESVLSGTHTVLSAVESWWFHIPLYRSNLVLFLSEHNMSLAANLGLDQNRMQWIRNFFDDNLYITPSSLPVSISVPSHPVVLFIGQLKLRKGFDLLVKAAPRLIARYPEIQFVVLSTSGQGWEKLRSILSESGTSGHFVLFDQASNEEKDALLTHADVLVVPSRYEGFGIPILEAFGAGCPVVATDVVAINEIIRHSENGWLVPPEDPEALADGVFEVLHSSKLKAKLVEGGRVTMLHYRVERHLPRVIALYEELVQESTGN
jgi:glycosyltransferase involved in cell wall biosynthesis